MTSTPTMVHIKNFIVIAGAAALGFASYANYSFDLSESILLAILAILAMWSIQSFRRRQNILEMTNEKLLTVQSALREREDRLKTILHSAADALVTLNDKLKIATVNRAAEDLFEYQKEELVGKSIYVLLDEDSRSKIALLTLELQEKHRDDTSPANCELAARTKSGRHLCLEAALSSAVFGTRQIFTVILRDMTERRALEVQLRHAQKLESIGQLAAGIAHEINTPIQFIGDNTRFLHEEFKNLRNLISRCCALADSGVATPAVLEEIAAARKQVDYEYLDKEIPAAISQTLDGVARVTRIVRAMKEFSHPGTSQKQSIDINKAIESTIIVSTNEWKYVAEMDTRFDPDLPLVPCLPGEFNQVVLNLLINAAHAIQEKKDAGDSQPGRISVVTRRAGSDAEIRISDTGCGISHGIASKIFDPFFTTKEVGKGTGQGLSIARSIIVTKHGGTIRFESDPAAGTTFILTLPLLEPVTESTTAHPMESL